MKDRTNEEGIDPATNAPADDARRRGMDESCRGGKHGAPQERTMIEAILEPENLAQAWQRVKANKGAPGIDGMTVEDFPAFAREHWPRIAIAIENGIYHPAPVRRVWIPKPDGTKRPLGIPTVLDRVIQQAVAQVLGPLFEVDFSEHSYGYRPGRSAHHGGRRDGGKLERRPPPRRGMRPEIVLRHGQPRPPDEIAARESPLSQDTWASSAAT